MTEMQLNEFYSNHYIRKWKKQGLPLIKERPATTYKEVFEKFIMQAPKVPEQKRKVAIARTIENKLNFKNYLGGNYKWQNTLIRQ